VSEKAFSRFSIAEGKRMGVYDTEGFRILSKIQGNEDELEAFNRVVPQVLLRNTSTCTRAKMPLIGEASPEELAFGQQKVSLLLLF
jgi:hypothetical protein